MCIDLDGLRLWIHFQLISIQGGIMLILERHSGESIQINDDTKLTIYYNKGNQIKIGIEAPRHVSIMREELLNSINKEKAKKETQVESITENKDKEPEYDLSIPEFMQDKKQDIHQVIIKTKRKKRVIMPNQ